MGAVTWDDLYREAAETLADRREARWIVEEASGEPLGRAVGPVPPKAELRVRDMVRRRSGGEPLQYVLGSWPFRRLELMVDRRVLIPRPETEQVVEVAFAELDRLRAGRRLTVVDLGTGSGAIALSFAREHMDVEVWALDSSAGAVAVAQANLAGLGGFAATRVRVVQGDWWDALPGELRGRVDLAVSNPPYISSAEMTELDATVRDWEPREALEAGPAGTEDIERVLAGSTDWLSPEASVVIELAPHHAEEAARVARKIGFGHVEVKPDLTGRARALVARR